MGIRMRTTDERLSASNARRCSSVKARQKPSYPWTLEPEILRRASTSSLVQKQSYADPASRSFATMSR